MSQPTPTTTFATTSTNDDPFTKIHRAIVHALISNEKLMEVVRPGNFLLHLDKSIVPKPSGTEADLPELEILPSGLTLNGSPSDGNHYTQAYTVQVSTANLNAEVTHRIKWGLLNSFNRLRHSNMGLDKLVISFRLTGISENLSEEPGRKIGWVLLAQVEIRLGIADWEVGL